MTHREGDPQTLIKPRDPTEKQRVTHTEGDPRTLIKPRDLKRNKE